MVMHLKYGIFKRGHSNNMNTSPFNFKIIRI